MALAVLMLISIFARLFRKAGPHQALIVHGFRGTRVIKGRGTVVFPMLETARELSLELMSFDVAPLRISTPARASPTLWKRSPKSKLRATLNRSLPQPSSSSPRAITTVKLSSASSWKVTSAASLANSPSKRSSNSPKWWETGCAPRAGDMSKMGLEVISFTIEEVRAKKEYISNMGRPDIARIKRHADVAGAEAERDTAIRHSPGLSPQPRLTRNASLPKPFPSPTNPKPSATWRSRRPSTSKLSSGNRPRPTRPTRSRPTSCSNK